MNSQALTGQQVAQAGLTGWTFLPYYGLGRLFTRIHTKDFAAGLQLVTAIGEAAREMNHHADLDLRPSHIDVQLCSGYEAGGVTETDVRLARRVSELAAAAGTEQECHSVSRIELALDTPEHEKIAPFWAAVLDRPYLTGEGWADVGDPKQVLPLIWFQPSDSEEPRQRWHVDVFLDPALVRRRIDAALAAGGRLVSDHGPSHWVLSDPDGNKVCLSTWEPGDTVIG